MLNWKRFAAIVLLGLTSIGAIADENSYDKPYDNKSSGALILLPPHAGYDGLNDDAVWLHLAGREYRSGAGWWALRCNEGCELIPLSLTVASKDHAQYDDKPMPGQVLQFAPKLATEGVIAVFKPFRAPLDKLKLAAGPVKSWGLGGACKPKTGIRHEGGHIMGGELALAGGEKLLFVPRLEQLAKGAVAEEGAARQVELEVRWGGKRQWVGNFSFDITWGEGSTVEPSQYVRWVGDLDNDGKPDFIIDTDSQGTQLTLYLSSLAGPGEIVGMAGSFHYFAPDQAGC
jgi:hypothetical protein